MRITCQDDTPLLLQDAPYAGSLGAALYLAAVDPDSDADPSVIEYRRCRTFDGADGFISGVDGMFDLGASSVPKSPAVAFIDSPDDEFRYSIPVDWHGKTIWAQVRTHAADYENETLYRPRKITLDGSGDDDTPVYGTATILAAEKRDDGGLRVRFSFTASRTGATPTAFTLTSTLETLTPGAMLWRKLARPLPNRPSGPRPTEVTP